jgi:hypothetical protein
MFFVFAGQVISQQEWADIVAERRGEEGWTDDEEEEDEEDQ